MHIEWRREWLSSESRRLLSISCRFSYPLCASFDRFGWQKSFLLLHLLLLLLLSSSSSSSSSFPFGSIRRLCVASTSCQPVKPSNPSNQPIQTCKKNHLQNTYLAILMKNLNRRWPFYSDHVFRIYYQLN